MLNASSDMEKRSQDWSRSEQLVALHETHALDEAALQVWCRERGLFAHHLEAWRTAFCLDGKPAAVADAREARNLLQENDKLRKQLDRKDKALADAAALLLLQKKFNALWEDEVK